MMKYVVLAVLVGVFAAGCTQVTEVKETSGYQFEGLVLVDSLPKPGAIVQVEVAEQAEEPKQYEDYTDSTGAYEIFAPGQKMAEAKIRAGIFPGPEWSPWDQGIVEPSDVVVDTFWF